MMKPMIEPIPNDITLTACQQAWDLTELTFVRKMENIVFSCQRHGQTVFLRLTTPLRRTKPQIEAELQFITHLAQAGLRVPNILLNSYGQPLLTIKEGSQLYEAVVFSQVAGEHPSADLMVTPNFLNSLGTLIATMHQVSQKYEPLSAREHWYEERGLRHALEAANKSDQTQMRTKLATMIKWIEDLEKTPETYGLIHADLGALNLFVTAEGSIGIIDFDDSCYHFHAFDLAIVIYSMASRFSHPVANHLEKEWLNHLIAGYSRVRLLTPEQIEQIPHFIDFACLRLYFWIEYHQSLNTFHKEVIERVLAMKQWALNRIIPS